MIYTVTLNPAVDKEYIVPEIEFDQVLRAEATRIDMGGKGFNVSRMLKKLGAESVAVAFAGGHCGALLRDGMFRLGINTDFIWIDGETRANISVLNGRREQYIKVNEAGPVIKAASFTALQARIGELVQPGDWWVFGGSLPPGLPEDSYAILIDLIQKKGGFALLDSSGGALATGCAAAPFLVKPNLAEAQELTGLPVDNPTNLVAAATAIRALGPQNVVVSRGPAGALLAGPEGVWLANSPSVTVANPIGAGDALLGGLAWALAAGETVYDALPWGLACGASTAAQEGTGVGTLETTQALRPQVSVSPLSPD